MRWTIRAAIAAALALATVGVARRLPRTGDAPYDVAVIPRAPVLRVLSLGHPTLAANLFWLRTVQYVGEPRANARGWEKLLPLADLVTDLDPAHGYAYQVAGTLLGSVHRVDESNAILEKGIRNVPQRYILPFLRAFNAFYYQDDYASAGRYSELAARTPGAPEHLRQNALAMYVKGKRAEAALAFLEESRRSARDPETLKAIDEQIGQALLERDVEPLDEAIQSYRAWYFFPPLVLSQLVFERLVPAIPRDPFGGEYVVGEDGRVHSSVHPFRFSPPEHRRRREPGVHPESYAQ